MGKVFAIVLAYTITTCTTTQMVWTGPTSILGGPTLTDPDFNNPVTVWHRQSWQRNLTMPEWDQISIYSLEHFGLPGDRYITDISMDRMIWNFRDSRDALMFKLRWSEVAC